ncbi:MAG: hypothetical protein FWG87_07380 [Defluviitaleaceae bacterium]|nr:hypothetical protein [Defluviitaleaceae bacterium]
MVHRRQKQGRLRSENEASTEGAELTPLWLCYDAAYLGGKGSVTSADVVLITRYLSRHEDFETIPDFDRF